MKLEQDYIAITPLQILMQTPEIRAQAAPEDIDYVKNFSSEKRISTTLVMRNYCRSLLFKLTGIEIEYWKIKINPNGRRFAVSPKKIEYTVSFAHSPHWVGIAISNGPIGIDIEEQKAARNWKEMLPFLDIPESTSKIKTEKEFLTRWTEYEARFKYASAASGQLPPCIHHKQVDPKSTLCIASNNAGYYFERHQFQNI